MLRLQRQLRRLEQGFIAMNAKAHPQLLASKAGSRFAHDRRLLQQSDRTADVVESVFRLQLVLRTQQALAFRSRST